MITVQKEQMAVTLLLVVGIILSIFWFLPKGSLPEEADLDSFSAARAMQHLSSIARAPHAMGSSQQAAVREAELRLDQLKSQRQGHDAIQSQNGDGPLHRGYCTVLV